MAKSKKVKPKTTSQKAKPKARTKHQKDEEREQRIAMEIVVDAYNEEERAMGWQCYLEEKLSDPFRARCIEAREVSPLEVGDEVDVLGIAQECECHSEMFVSIPWN